MRQRHGLLVLLLLAGLGVACSRDPKPRELLPGATEVPVSRSAVATLPPIEGIPVTALTLGPPADIPPGLVLYVAGGCTHCDGPPTTLDRVYRDASGALRSDRIFERQLRVEGNTTFEENYIRTLRVASNGRDIVVGVCDRGYCGGVGNPTPDANTTFYSSTDGGSSWETIGVLPGDTWIVANEAGRALVRHASTPTPGGPYEWRLVQLPGGETMPVDPAIDLRTAEIVTAADWTPLVRREPGNSLWWMPGPVAGADPWLSVDLPGWILRDARFSPGGTGDDAVLLRACSPVDDPRCFLGLMAVRSGKPSRLFLEREDGVFSVGFGAWLGPALLVANAGVRTGSLPPGARFTAVESVFQGVPVLIDLASGVARPIEPLFARIAAGDRAEVVGAAREGGR